MVVVGVVAVVVAVAVGVVVLVVLLVVAVAVVVVVVVVVAVVAVLTHSRSPYRPSRYDAGTGLKPGESGSHHCLMAPLEMLAAKEERSYQAHNWSCVTLVSMWKNLYTR